MIDKATEQKIKDAADIVDVVSDYVHLVRRGANYMGLCPFHNERTPSFSVNKAKNFCYCFSCHKGGSPVNFIMEKEGISYYDALKHLANKYGIKVEERELSPEERERQTRREAMLLANEWAMHLMESDLTDNQEGRDIGLAYLYGRGVTEEAIKQFHLGYSLDSGHHLVDTARKRGFDINVLKSLGLVGTSQRGTDYDRFHGRVMFPILNSSGKVIAFGGRDLKGGPAKYINSPESELYKKSNELYGMFQARAEIVRQDKCFLVEGYLDVIGMWQSGLKNVIASSGTALTDGQISLIHRFTGNVTLIYDGDEAGIKASLRGIDMLLSHGLDIKVLLLPDGHDPDSFARANTPDQFRQYIEEHETDIIRFKARVLMQRAKNDPSARAAAIQSVVESIACISNKVKRDIYVQECASLMGVSEDSISLQIQKVRPKIVESFRKARERESIERIPPSYRPVQSQPSDDQLTGQTQSAQVSGQEGDSIVPRTHAPVSAALQRLHKIASNPLAPLEKDVAKYAVRYGLMDFCQSEEDENGNKYILTVAEYLNEEMELNELTFTVESYRRVFQRVLDMIEPFRKMMTEKQTEFDASLDQRRKDAYQEIASRGLDLQQIEIEEKNLEVSLEQERFDMIQEFSRDFPSSQLASDIDDDVRITTTELMTEPHELSNLYLKKGDMTLEENNLVHLLPRVITEWKTEIIERQIKSLMARLKSEAGELSDDDYIGIQKEINDLMIFRNELAKHIGERILSPKRRY